MRNQYHLDPIAIFVLHWGVTGAALATIAGQFVSAVLAAYYLFHAKSFRLDPGSMLIRFKYLAKYCRWGSAVS